MSFYILNIKNWDTEQYEPCVPSELTWILQDVSAADSGRDQSGTMHTNVVAKKRKLELKYNGIEWSKASHILQLINHEPIHCYYPDMLSGVMEKRKFYVGDREAPVFIWQQGNTVLASLSFNLIEI